MVIIAMFIAFQNFFRFDDPTCQKPGLIVSTESCGIIEGYDLAPSNLFHLIP